MALVTGQQASRYYDAFNKIDVIFTKEVSSAIGLLPKNIFLKHVGSQIPCVIYATSMAGSKVIANVKSDIFAQIRRGNNVVSLRFSFIQPDRATPLSFYVNAKIAGFSPYGKENGELNFVSLIYPQRPPDDLIMVLGQLLEANVNAKKRREERITMTTEITAKIGLRGNDAAFEIDGERRKCIVRDISFSGARLIVPGPGRLLNEKTAVLDLDLDGSTLHLPGKIIRIESIAEREDIAAVALLFDEQAVPLTYKMRINDYLTSIRPSLAASTAIKRDAGLK